MIIRNAELTDEEPVYEMLCDLEESRLDKELFHLVYMEYLEDTRMHCLISQEGDEVTGVLNLRIGAMLCHTGKIAEIVELVVRDGARSKGTGGQLFHRAVEIAEEAGCIRLEVSSNLKRIPAHRFYEKQGMERSHARFIIYLGRGTI